MSADLAKVQEFVSKIEAFMVNDLQTVISGKANFLSALGLLDYTEIVGGLVTGKLISGPKTCNFKAFLKYLGKPYLDLDANFDIYGRVRSGLVHQYLLNQQGTIRMGIRHDDICGIIIKDDGWIEIVVEKYFDDFKKAIQNYKDDLLVKQCPALIEAIQKIPMDKI
ncbi:MAG: hypothetical protein HYX82_03155 [Chloroflexi bacterium]|nr:hypothetical protein [Chloroflexota bacterium]